MGGDDSRRAELLARIRKCLALGKSGNENEAAAALAKARALMDAYGITADDVALSEIGEESVRGNCAQRPPRWESTLCHTVRRAIGVDVILSPSGERIYIGPGAAPQVACYAFAVLYRKLKAARADYTRTKLKRCNIARKRQRADIYCEAWAEAVYVQVKRLMPARPVDAAVGQYIAKRFGNLVSVDSRAASTKGGRIEGDQWNGYLAGREVELHNAVGGNACKTELLA